MRRVIAFFGWQVKNWNRIADEIKCREVQVGALAAADLNAQKQIREGKISYAYQQANTRERMKHHCEKKWQVLSSRLLNMEDGDATKMIEYCTTS
jgi:hypothetical protein